GTVIAQCHGAFGQGLVVGSDSPAFSESPEIFGGIKAEATLGPQGANGAVFVAGTVGLGSVFDDGKPVFTGHSQNGIHITGMSVEMNRQNGFGFGSDRVFDFGRIDLVGFRLDIHVNRVGPDVGNGPT